MGLDMGLDVPLKREGCGAIVPFLVLAAVGDS